MKSSADGQLYGEPISKLFPGSGNMGGFRVSGRGALKNWVVMLSTGEDRDWPDTLDLNTGKFVYYGDNKTLATNSMTLVPGGTKCKGTSLTGLMMKSNHVQKSRHS